jgi:hypothetical protein
MAWFKQLIRLAFAAAPETPLSVQQVLVESGGFQNMCYVATPLGISLAVPAEALGLKMQTGEESGNTVFFPLEGQSRISGLVPGDMVLHNPLIPGTQLALNADGKLAFGNDIGEVLSILQNVIADLQAATVNTSLGPQPLDAATQLKLLVAEQTLELMKGSLK